MMTKRFSLLAFFLLPLLFVSPLLAQNRSLRGTVTDGQNAPIAGASISLKKTTVGTVTDSTGGFRLEIPASVTAVLRVASVGYLPREMTLDAATENLRIRLEEDETALGEVVVTGVFSPGKRAESSVAVTVLDRKTLDRTIPNSATELLRQVPGVFTNTTRGEIYNSVVVRGMALGSEYYYVSMQEDGLPIIPATGQFSPDAFLRADLTLGRIEALRGGTASILGANAPGGIFNYISRTGESRFEGEIRARTGLEGNGKNPYYRMEMAFGGPLSKKDSSLTWFAGGHYRYANGAKYPGYPLSRGGQWKANVLKKYERGQVKFHLKYLRDRTVQMESTPTTNFDHPQPAGNFDNNSSLLNPEVSLHYPASVLGIEVDYDSKNLNLYTDLAAGLQWSHRLGKGWSMENAARFSNKTALVNSSFIVYPFSVDKFWFYAVNGLLGKFGTYRFYNPQTGQQYGTVEQALDFSNPDFPFAFHAKLNLPGAEVQPNSIFYNPLAYEKSWMRDFVDQFALKKHWQKMTFTAGIYHASSWMQQYLTPPAATGYGTIEDQPQLVAIDYIPSGMPDPLTYHFTDPNGISAYGNGGLFDNKATVRQTAFFFGHNWDITPRLNADWGLRYEAFKVKGRLARPQSLENTLGGVDGDSTTLYDNGRYILSNYAEYDSPLNTFSFSGGLNYCMSQGLHLYARYARGSKTPDFNFFNDNSNVLDIEAQRTVQWEFGARFSKGASSVSVTPFYSALDKIPNLQRGQNEGLPPTFYATPKIYNKTHAVGVELEASWALSAHWSLRTNAVFQRFTADRYQYFDTRLNGPADDTLIDRSRKQISIATPALMFNLTPTWQRGPLSASLNWYFMGKRAANASETFYLPAFSQFDLQVGWAISPKLSLQVTVNNLLNTFGILSWTAPTNNGLAFSTFNTDLFSPEARAADPEAVYYTIGLQPRAYFLTCGYRF